MAEIRRLNGYLGDNYHLFPATNESELFSVLVTHAIDLMLIDGEPGSPWDGVQTCSLLKSMPPFAHLPIVLLVPANNAATRIGYLQSGADACMEKPFSGDYLRVQIGNLLANRHRIRNHLSRSMPFNTRSLAGMRNKSAFLVRLNSFICEHLSDPALDVDGLARLMNISLPTLYRKIKSVSDTTPNELINSVRLDKAAELLAFGGYKVFQVAKMVGFNSRSNFGRAFTRQFGVTPKEYQQTA